VVVVVIVIIAVTVAMIVVIVIATVITFMIMIPFVVVLDSAMRTFPIAVIEPLSIVARVDPASAFIRRATPITFMPAIVASGGIPVTADPDEFGSGQCRNDGDNTWFGRRTNTNPN